MFGSYDPRPGFRSLNRVRAYLPTLPSLIWKTSYRHEDGDLIASFHIPALECAVRYDRMTGYFSADALALAGRGIERLIANGGAMRLIVGCTLDEAEVQAIEQGYDLRAIVEEPDPGRWRLPTCRPRTAWPLWPG